MNRFFNLIKDTYQLLRKNYYYLFISSFLDIVFLLLFGFVYGALSSKILEQAVAFGTDINTNAPSIGSMLNVSYLIKVLFLLLFLLFTLFLIWNVIQSPNFRLAKSIVDDKKYDRKAYLMKFSKANIFIFMVFGLWWVLSYFYDFAALKEAGAITSVLFVISIALLLFLAYFAMISYYLALEENPFKRSFRFAYKRFIPLFIIFLGSIAAFLLIDFLSSVLTNLFRFFIDISQVLYLIGILFNAIVLLPFLAYIRLYFFGAISLIEGKKESKKDENIKKANKGVNNNETDYETKTKHTKKTKH